MKLLALERVMLPNGLSLYLGQSPESTSFEIAVHIDSGSRDENSENNGVSHFLEHMMFRGNRNWPNSILLAQTLENFGGETNAMTTVESTVYWLRGATRRMETAIGAFADFFFHPNFADLETERNIILQELQGDYNEDGDLIDAESLAMNGLFADHPLGLPIIGTQEVIKKMSVAQLEEKRALFYTPQRCAVSLVSSFSPERVRPWLEKAFGGGWAHVGAHGTPDRRLIDPAVFSRVPLGRKHAHALRLQNNSDSQYVVKIMWPCSGGLNARVVEETFLQRILDDGISSRLPAVIREQQGLVYDISADSSAFLDVGTFSVDATVSKDDIDKLLARLFDELMKMMNQKPSEEEMARIRFRYGFDLESMAEAHGRYVSREVWNGFLGQTLSIEQELEIVQNMTASQILETAQRVFGCPRRSFVLIGPRSRKKRDDVEKFFEQLC
jgi:predicted Zn-dependent peptidase